MRDSIPNFMNRTVDKTIKFDWLKQKNNTKNSNAIGKENARHIFQNKFFFFCQCLPVHESLQNCLLCFTYLVLIGTDLWFKLKLV